MKRLLSITFFLFSTLFSLEPRLQEGFYSGTLVKTPKGNICIEQIKPGDEVISYDETAKIYRINVVTKHIKIPSTTPLAVTIAGVTFVAQNRHKIYTLNNFSTGQLIQDLEKKIAVLTYDNAKEIVNIHATDLVLDAYTLTVAHDNNFLIGGEERILVHNINPSIMIATTETASSLWTALTTTVGASAIVYDPSRNLASRTSSSPASTCSYPSDPYADSGSIATGCFNPSATSKNGSNSFTRSMAKFEEEQTLERFHGTTKITEKESALQRGREAVIRSIQEREARYANTVAEGKIGESDEIDDSDMKDIIDILNNTSDKELEEAFDKALGKNFKK